MHIRPRYRIRGGLQRDASHIVLIRGCDGHVNTGGVAAGDGANSGNHRSDSIAFRLDGNRFGGGTTVSVDIIAHHAISVLGVRR